LFLCHFHTYIHAAFLSSTLVNFVHSQKDNHPLARMVMSECLMSADMLGASPPNLLLVGISGKCYEPGHPLSAAVRHSVQPAIDAILHELQRLGFTFRKKIFPDETLFVERSRIFGSTRNARINNERRSHPAIRTRAAPATIPSEVSPQDRSE
jgi:hypothetical protein